MNSLQKFLLMWKDKKIYLLNNSINKYILYFQTSQSSHSLIITSAKLLLHTRPTASLSNHQDLFPTAYPKHTYSSTHV